MPEIYTDKEDIELYFSDLKAGDIIFVNGEKLTVTDDTWMSDGHSVDYNNVWCTDGNSYSPSEISEIKIYI